MPPKGSADKRAARRNRRVTRAYVIPFPIGSSHIHMLTSILDVEDAATKRSDAAAHILVISVANGTMLVILTACQKRLWSHEGEDTIVLEFLEPHNSNS